VIQSLEIIISDLRLRAKRPEKEASKV